jgi:hypothetical protein
MKSLGTRLEIALFESSAACAGWRRSLFETSCRDDTEVELGSGHRTRMAIAEAVSSGTLRQKDNSSK